MKNKNVLKKYLSKNEILEGKQIPRFYLPVISPKYKYAYELWPFYLAPFVIFWQILSNAFWIIWGDLMGLTRSLNFFKKNKNKL